MKKMLLIRGALLATDAKSNQLKELIPVSLNPSVVLNLAVLQFNAVKSARNVILLKQHQDALLTTDAQSSLFSTKIDVSRGSPATKRLKESHQLALILGLHANQMKESRQAVMQDTNVLSVQLARKICVLPQLIVIRLLMVPR